MLDHEKRKELSIRIRKAMDSVNQKILKELKWGHDESEFASIKVLTDSPEEINGHLEAAKRAWDCSFWIYSDEIKSIMEEVEALNEKENIQNQKG